MKFIRILFFPLRLIWGALILTGMTFFYGMGADIDIVDGYKETWRYILKG
jgi:hypothetical protein